MPPQVWRKVMTSLKVRPIVLATLVFGLVLICLSLPVMIHSSRRNHGKTPELINATEVAGLYQMPASIDETYGLLCARVPPALSSWSSSTRTLPCRYNRSTARDQSVFVVLTNHADWFRRPIDVIMRSLFTNVTYTSYNPNSSNLWVWESWKHEDAQPSPAVIYREIGQRRIFITGESIDSKVGTSASDLDGMISSTADPFQRPFGVPAVFLPYYIAAMLNWGDETLRTDAFTPPSSMVNRRFAAYAASNCVAQRDHFFDLASRYRSVDALGRCKSDRPQRRSWEATLQLYRGYKFVMSMEHAVLPGYITEKIAAAMLAESIPIYYGAPDIALHFNPRRFIDLSRFNNLQDAIDYIAYLDQNDEAYLSMLSQPHILHEDWLLEPSSAQSITLNQVAQLRDLLLPG